MKQCSKCKLEKELSQFSKDKHAKLGITHQCKECRNSFNRTSENSKRLRREYKKNNKKLISEQGKEHYKKNKEKVLLKNKLWYKNNKKRHLELSKKWSQNNKDKVAEYTKKSRDKINKRQKERIATDDLFKFRRAVSSRVSNCFRVKNWKKNGTTESMLGCGYKEAKAYLESKFKEGMSWENRSEWHIDHIIPLASAKTKEELIKLTHYTNLQPLWAIENIIKSNKIL